MSLPNPIPTHLATLGGEELSKLIHMYPASVFSFVGHVHEAGDGPVADHNHDLDYAAIDHTHLGFETLFVGSLSATGFISESLEATHTTIHGDTLTEGNIQFENIDRAIRWPNADGSAYDEILKYGLVGGAPSVATHGGVNTNYHRFLAGGKETVIRNDGFVQALGFIGDGSQLTDVKPVASMDITANRPATPFVGQMFFDTTLAVDGKPIWFNGTNWVDATGTIA